MHLGFIITLVICIAIIFNKCDIHLSSFTIKVLAIGFTIIFVMTGGIKAFIFILVLYGIYKYVTHGLM